MKIELSEDEIKSAIIGYVCEQGFSIDAAKAEVDLKAGRGENGATATVSVGKPEVNPVSEAPTVMASAKAETTPAPSEPSDSKKLKFGSNVG